MVTGYQLLMANYLIALQASWIRYWKKVYIPAEFWFEWSLDLISKCDLPVFPTMVVHLAMVVEFYLSMVGTSSVDVLLDRGLHFRIAIECRLRLRIRRWKCRRRSRL